MLTAALYILYGLASIFIVQKYSKEMYAVPRTTLIVLGTFVALCFIGVYGVALELPTDVVVISSTMLGWWFICSAVSIDNRNALTSFMYFSAVVVGCMLVTKEYLELGVTIFVIGGVLNAIYAIIQKVFRYEPLKTNSNRVVYYAIGFLGNSSFMAVYLVPITFLSLWLGFVSSYFWFLTTILFLYVIYLTRCRSAFVGLGLAGVYILFTQTRPEIAVGSFCILCAIILVLSTHKKLMTRLRLSSPKERLNYWRVALWQILRQPVFGLGFDNFRMIVPFVQRELNIKSNGKFLNPDNYEAPYPAKAHSDFIQHVLDNGFIGLGFIGLLVIMALSGMSEPTIPKLFMYAGLISFIGMGAFLHTFHLPMSNVLFWFFVFTLLRTEQSIIFEPNLMYTIPALFIVGCFIYKYTINEYRFDYRFQKFFRTNHQYLTLNALKLRPYSSACHTFMVDYYLKTGVFQGMFHHAMVGLSRYDGQQKFWELWYNMGLACLSVGSPAMAQFCYKQALQYLPNYDKAKEGLEMIKDILAQVKEAPHVQRNESNKTV